MASWSSRNPPKCILFCVASLLTLLPDLVFSHPHTLAQCGDNLYQCEGTINCIPRSWLCDGEADCPFGDDENTGNCPETPTLTSTTREASNTQAPTVTTTTPQSNTTTCSPEQFKCQADMCIPIRWQCDREFDCANGEDEDRCEDRLCPNSTYACQRNRGDDAFSCISKQWLCDQQPDCPLGDDEKNCTDRTCAPDHHQCNSEVPVCIKAEWLCDGDRDCSSGEDEENCPIGASQNHTCSDAEFDCRMNNLCIHLSWRCDGEVDCPNASDEEIC